MQSVIDLAVIGGGAAGLACALKGSQLGLKVILLEKTERCGKKIALTGGEKCNFTHLEPPGLMVKRFDGPREKLLPLLRRFPHQVVITFFRKVGIEPRVDSAGCVWPKAMTASELRDRLVQAVLSSGVEIKLNSGVQEIKPGWLIVLKTGATIEAKNVVVATGGASYPQTGSTGDGNRLVQPLRISTTPFFPALAALKPKLNLEHLAGVTHPLVEVRVNLPNVYPRRGSFLFAHEFISGSAVMNISGFVARALMQGLPVEIKIDWVPGEKREELNLSFLRLRTDRPLLQAKTALGKFVARRVAAFICFGADVAPERRLSELKKTELNRLIEWLKG
ncbi:MAG: aminoacetone oxidase family FAD-binding enzyme, partial [bacterium]